MMATDHRISVKDAADKMKLDKRQVQVMVFAGKIDGGKDKHGWWVDDRSVAKYLDSN